MTIKKNSNEFKTALENAKEIYVNVDCKYDAKSNIETLEKSMNLMPQFKVYKDEVLNEIEVYFYSKLSFTLCL